jgi:hypothetical protein
MDFRLVAIVVVVLMDTEWRLYHGKVSLLLFFLYITLVSCISCPDNCSHTESLNTIPPPIQITTPPTIQFIADESTALVLYTPPAIQLIAADDSTALVAYEGMTLYFCCSSFINSGDQ